MVILDAEYQFDRHKLTFFFEADRRIDFRELVSELFSQYKTRIWMQQVDTSVLPLHDAGTDLAKATGFLPLRDDAEYMRQAQYLMRGGGGGGGGGGGDYNQSYSQQQQTMHQQQRVGSPRGFGGGGGGGGDQLFSDYLGGPGGGNQGGYGTQTSYGAPLSFDGLTRSASSSTLSIAAGRDDPFSFGMSGPGSHSVVRAELRRQGQGQGQYAQESMGSMLEEPWAFGRSQS
jgi:hypothetical protein